MKQFFAILKDSFREAVDGFVIYAMLGMSALVILIVGSMSFTPARRTRRSARSSSQEFTRFFPDRVGAGHQSPSTTPDYAAANVQPDGSGYKLRSP